MYFQLENKQLFCWQWDTCQKIIVEGMDELNLQIPYLLIGNVKDVDGLYRTKVVKEKDCYYAIIPDEVLQKEGHAEVFLQDESTGTTSIQWRFTIKKRQKPKDYVYEETSQLTLKALFQKIEQLEYQLNELQRIPGPRGIPGERGPSGITPQKGIDYFTDKDKEEITASILSSICEWKGGIY